MEERRVEERNLRPRDSMEAVALPHGTVNQGLDSFGSQRGLRRLARHFRAASARLGDCWIWEQGKGRSQM